MGGFGFIQHQGTPIYLIDLEGLDTEQVLALLPQAAREIRAQPERSVRTLTHVKGVKLEPRVNEAMKQLAAGNRPHVKAAAICGLTPAQKVVLTAVKLVTRRDFSIFDSVEQAKAHLARA